MCHIHTSTSWERQDCSLLGLKNRTLASNVYFSVKTGWDENKMRGGLAFTHTHTHAQRTPTHAVSAYRHKPWIVWGLSRAAYTHRNIGSRSHTHTGTTSMWLPQRPLSHVEQIHTSTVMSVCSSQPHTADLFIRNSAAQGHPVHSPAFLFLFFLFFVLYNPNISWSVHSHFFPA